MFALTLTPKARLAPIHTRPPMSRPVIVRTAYVRRVRPLPTGAEAFRLTTAFGFLAVVAWGLHSALL